MHPNDGRVVSNFVIQALRGLPITVYGQGAQTRSFCYVDDLVDALVKLMSTPDEFTGPVNLGNPVEHTILELAELIVDLTGSRSEIVLEPLPQDDPVQRRPDIALARRVLDWLPTVSLEEGLAKTIAYFDGVLRDGSPAPLRSVAMQRSATVG
jgi:UDP-glucuronate decarboxylase